MTSFRAAVSPATIAETAAWWAMLVGVWLLTLSSSVNAAEVVVAGACAVPCAITARLARSAVEGRWRFRVAWLAWAGPLLKSTVTDAVRVLAIAVGRAGEDRVGQLFEVSLPEEDDEAHAAGRESLAELTLSTTPGSFVVHGDPQTLVAHSLSHNKSGLVETVTR
ncbi:MAG TPA: hypothetical protein VFT75_16060 [Nocardioidaceae bacterium]|nr:hypothetical protein [Nocardioidaceae bacterium]